jgi:hypothetical protein
MVLLSCSGPGGGIYAKQANGAARHNCTRLPPNIHRTYGTASSFEHDPGALSTYRARRVARMTVSINDRSSSIPNIGGSE